MLASVVIYDQNDEPQAAMVFEGYDERITLMNLLREVAPSAYKHAVVGQYCEEDVMRMIADHYDHLWVVTANNEQELEEKWEDEATEGETLRMLTEALNTHLEGAMDEYLIDEA